MAFRLRLAASLVVAAVVSLDAGPIAKIAFTDTRLKNGLRVIVSEDHTAPVFAIVVNYNVGSRDERKGRTGFAHLFEHMMFKGSENVGQNEHPYLIFMNGGTMNGTTSKDRTLYYEALPANQLDLGLFLEADRMRSLAMTITKDNLDNQRNAVQEERRSGVDNQPYGKTRESLEDLAYDNFAYEHSVIGSMADLNAASVDDVASFFKTYYAPNNAVIAIVGDVDTKTVLAKMEKYFGPIPQQPAPPMVDMTEPPQKEERRLTLDDALARLPRIDMAYKVPPSDGGDKDALDVLATILSGGRSGRFYEAIVRQKQLATNVAAFSGDSRGPGLFNIVATPSPGKPVAEVEAAIDAEIERVKSGPIEDWELEKARMSAKRQFLNNISTSLSKAILMTETTLLYGKPDRVNTTAETIARITAADVQRVANQYLMKTGRTVVVTMPKAGPAKGGAR
jgi:zinc protease